MIAKLHEMLRKAKESEGRLQQATFPQFFYCSANFRRNMMKFNPQTLTNGETGGSRAGLEEIDGITAGARAEEGEDEDISAH